MGLHWLGTVDGGWLVVGGFPLQGKKCGQIRDTYEEPNNGNNTWRGQHWR